MNEPHDELREVGTRLTGLANGLTHRYGPLDAVHLLFSTAMALALGTMAKHDVIELLRTYIVRLSEDDDEARH